MASDEIEELIRALRQDDGAAMERLVPLIYDDLKRIARRHLSSGRPGATLNTTAVVHEAYMRIAKNSSWEGRQHFFAVASRAMRHVIVDFARARRASKRGNDPIPVSLDKVHLSVDQQADVMLEIDSALDRLTAVNPRACHVFECRYFGGLSERETSEALETSLRSVQRDWSLAKAFLRVELGT